MDIKDLKGQVVTIRTVTGEEIITRLKDVEKNGSVITVTNPLVVLLSEQGQPITLPYSLTGVNDIMMFQTRNIFSITPAIATAAEEYEIQTLPQEDEVEFGLGG